MAQDIKHVDLLGLEALALTQGGYFHCTDAHDYGVSKALLSYHTRTGRFERIFPCVYRLQRAPVAPHDSLILAWVWSSYRGVISHESALALYELSDVLPSRVQITVPPNMWRPSAPFDLHRSSLQEDEVTTYEGVPVTTPARSIVDAAAGGTDPEQIHKAVRQAIQRALAGPEQIRRAARRKGYRHRRTVEPLVERAIEHAAA